MSYALPAYKQKWVRRVDKNSSRIERSHREDDDFTKKKRTLKDKRIGSISKRDYEYEY